MKNNVCCAYGVHRLAQYPGSFALATQYNQGLSHCQFCGIYWCVTDLNNEKHFYTYNFNELTAAMQMYVKMWNEEKEDC